MPNIIKYTSHNCPYAFSCYRKFEEEPPNNEQQYFNYQYQCNDNSGFDSFVPQLE